MGSLLFLSRVQLPGLGFKSAPMAGTTVAWPWLGPIAIVEGNVSTGKGPSLGISRANSRPGWLIKFAVEGLGGRAVFGVVSESKNDKTSY